MNRSSDNIEAATASRPMRRRGIERYNLILDATEQLLTDIGDEEISLAQIAEIAGVSLASVYYFFPNRNAVHTALAQRFSAEIYRHAILPPVDPEPQSWQELIEMKHQAGAEFQNSRPAAMRLFMGAGVSASVRNADFSGNARIAHAHARMLEAYFEVPPMPELAQWLETSAAAMDGIWALSYGRHGHITEAYRREATACAITYLRRYLPKFLPRKPLIQSALESIPDEQSRDQCEGVWSPDGWVPPA